MGYSVSALPQQQGGNWPVLLHADIFFSPGVPVTCRDSPEMRSAPFLFQSAARTKE